MVRQWLVFVAVVWSIAGAFLVLHLGLPALFHRLLVAGWIPAELALPDRGAAPVAVHCDDVGVVPEPGPSRAAEARFGAWKLGQELGFAAANVNLGYSLERLAPILAGVVARAKALGVPPPSLPPIRSSAYALAEFQQLVRADPQCVGTVLARRFGEAAAHLYRFGLVVGYVAPVRARGLGALFPAEIAHYGRRAGVPEPLWRPLAQETLVGPDGAAGPETVWAIVERLDAHVGSGG